MIFCIFQSELLHGIISPLVQDLAFLPGELQEVLVAHLCDLSGQLWMAASRLLLSAPPPRFLSSANLQRVHSVLSSRSLMEKLKCGLQYWPLECTTGLKSPVRFHVHGYKPLISTARPTSSLFYTVHTWAVRLFCESVMGDSVESLAKFKVNNIYCFPVDAVQCCARDSSVKSMVRITWKNIINFVK